MFNNDDDLIRRAKLRDQMAIDELFRKYKNVVDYKARGYSRATIPQVAVQSQGYLLLRAAIDKFDPRTRVNGAPIQFKTFLESELRGLARYVHSNKSVVRLPENKLLNIQNFASAKSSLAGMFGREPTPLELAQHLGWKLSQVDAMERSLNRSVFSAAESDERKFGVQHSVDVGDKFRQTKEYIYYTLTPDEQHVLDYWDGLHGKPKLTINQIAQKMNIGIDTVYRLRRAIDKKLFGNF